ncbi:MAG: PEP-CTERM sorting domain-containing protein [Pseudomonadota bacterium]
MLCVLASAQATPVLNYYAAASVNGSINTSYSSALLGDVSFQLYTPSVSTYNDGSNPSHSTGVALGSYDIALGGASGADPVYDIITNNGQYGFGYSGRAEASSTRLRTAISTSMVDNGAPSGPANSYLQANANAQWNQQLLITAATGRKAGDYGAFVVAMTLEGTFPAGGGYNSASSYAQLDTSFTDSAGVSYSSGFGTSTYAGDGSWTGSRTVFKKLLFQYGTVFNLGMWQQTYATNNGAANFFDTGYVSAIELPNGAVLLSGAEQAGLGNLGQLYGVVTNAGSVDDPNTNWDFGNNGGGFTPPPVPEPDTVLMLGGGLAVLAGLARRRKGAARRVA